MIQGAETCCKNLLKRSLPRAISSPDALDIAAPRTADIAIPARIGLRDLITINEKTPSLISGYRSLAAAPTAEVSTTYKNYK